MYVIRNSNGMWVRSGGNKSSFTNRRELADKYGTRQAAESNCCDNEWVESTGNSREWNT